MSWGASSHQQQQQQGTSTGNQTSASFNMPVQLPWVAQQQKNTGVAAQNLVAQASKPVYGDAQKAGYTQNLNDLANQSQAKINSQLASQGISDSGAASAAATQVQTGRIGQLSNFYAQLPFQEQQAEQTNMKSAIGASLAATTAAPTGQASGSTSSSNSSTDSNSTTDTQSNPGISGLVSSLAGLAAGGLMGGFGSLASGGSFGQGFGNAFATQPTGPNLGSGGSQNPNPYVPYSAPQGPSYNPGQFNSPAWGGGSSLGGPQDYNWMYE